PPPADTTPPTTSLTSPTANATVTGSVTLTATASDNVGVSTVEFDVDGSQFAVLNNPIANQIANTTQTFTAPTAWDTTIFANGSSHTIFVKATDAANNVSTSTTTTVTVSHPDPTPPPSPASITATVTQPTGTTNASVALSWPAGS